MTDPSPLPPPVRAHEPALRKVTADALLLVRTCSAAALTVARNVPILIVGTSPLARRLDQAQWASGQGPGIDAIHQLQVFNVADLAATRSWPEFTRLARSQGLRSSLAVPITWRGRAVGALNLYSTELDGFAGLEPLGLRLAGDAGQTLSVPAEEPSKRSGEDQPRTPAPAGADTVPRERAVS